MRHLFDFGISQEDPLTEFHLLDIQPNDHVLCIASAGEMPLSLSVLHPGVTITAVDRAEQQLQLCRFKMQAAILLPCPLNGEFLGYARCDRKKRRELYFDRIRETLETADQVFWDRQITAIGNGVVNNGRFELYIQKLRWIAVAAIGKKNIERLIACTGTAEQEMVFDKYIAGRKALQYLFRIAFHPAIYKKRGLNAQALQHAGPKTGDLFFKKFKSFCTATPAAKNYFLQYFLSGGCITNEAFPEYLQEDRRLNLTAGHSAITWKQSSLQEELAVQSPGTYNKIHLSNIGDWMSDKDFDDFLGLLCHQCLGQEKIVCRFLQKNHLANRDICRGRINAIPVDVEKTDRFPFYSIYSIRGHGKL